MSQLQVEARPYGPDSTPLEVAALKARIFLHPGASDIIVWQEVPVMTVFQVEKFGEKVAELASRLPSFRYLVDLREAPLPGPEIRAKLVSIFRSDPKPKRVAVFTGRNFLVNIACKFVFTAAGLTDFSIHKTEEQALAALNHDA